MTLPLELRRWPTECLAAWDHYVERAAFREFCGNQSREEAEREAEAEARRVFGGVPRVCPRGPKPTRKGLNG